jgi:hypothetical protein
MPGSITCFSYPGNEPPGTRGKTNTACFRYSAGEPSAERGERRRPRASATRVLSRPVTPCRRDRRDLGALNAIDLFQLLA